MINQPHVPFYAYLARVIDIRIKKKHQRNRLPEELRWLQYDRLYIVVAEKKTDANSKKYSATTIEHVPC